MADAPIASMVEAMLAKGVAAELVVMAIQTIEMSAGQSRDSHADKLEARRAADRLRKQKQRAKSIPSADTPEANDAGASVECHADSHVTDADKSCLLPSLLTDSPRSIQKVRKKKQAVVVERRARDGTRLEPDAKLSDENRKFAIDNGVPGPEALWAEFVDYWIAIPGQRGSKTNWNSTWRNRVRTVAGKTGAPSGQRGSRQFQNDALSVTGAIRKLGEQIEQGNLTFAPRPTLLPTESGNDRRLLSKG